MVGRSAHLHKDAAYDLGELRARIQQTTFLVPGVTIRLLDERDPDAVVDETFHHSGGIVDYVDHLTVGEPVTLIIRLGARVRSPRRSRCSTMPVT